MTYAANFVVVVVQGYTIDFRAIKHYWFSYASCVIKSIDLLLISVCACVCQERGQVLTALSYTNQHHELVHPLPELRRRLLELMLQGCIQDLKETGQ